MKLIKRYTNRKLYDTERSCYVTLEEIAEMVRDGEEVKIIDNKSGDDLTTVTLAQIVFEEEKRDRRMLPLQTLRLIIQAPGDFIQRLSRPMQDFGEQTRQQVDRLKKQAEAQQESLVAPLREFIENVQRNVDEMQARLDERMKDTVDALTHVPDLGTDIEQLRDRLDAVERDVAHIRTAVEQLVGGRLVGEDISADHDTVPPTQ
jgi:polyhydroxyalkanoate synthesis repressor PhaR